MILMSYVIRTIGDISAVMTLIGFQTRYFHSINRRFDKINSRLLFNISNKQLEEVENLQFTTNVLFHDIPKMVIFFFIYIGLINVQELDRDACESSQTDFT